MKKYLICSDIHGDYDSFKKVINYFEKEYMYKIIILGDLLYHGPRNDLPKNYAPKEVIKLANAYKDKIIMVRGNCEAEVDQMVLDFKIFKTKKLVIDHHNFYLEHGHHLDRNNPKFNKGDIVLSGHTHVSKVELINGIYFINPGSTTLPKENTQKSFIVYQNGYIQFINVDNYQVINDEVLFD